MGGVEAHTQFTTTRRSAFWVFFFRAVAGLLMFQCHESGTILVALKPTQVQVFPDTDDVRAMLDKKCPRAFQRVFGEDGPVTAEGWSRVQHVCRAVIKGDSGQPTNDEDSLRLWRRLDDRFIAISPNAGLHATVEVLVNGALGNPETHQAGNILVAALDASDSRTVAFTNGGVAEGAARCDRVSGSSLVPVNPHVAATIWHLLPSRALNAARQRQTANINACQSLRAQRCNIADVELLVCLYGTSARAYQFHILDALTACSNGTTGASGTEFDGLRVECLHRSTASFHSRIQQQWPYRLEVWGLTGAHCVIVSEFSIAATPAATAAEVSPAGNTPSSSVNTDPWEAQRTGAPKRKRRPWSPVQHTQAFSPKRKKRVDRPGCATAHARKATQSTYILLEAEDVDATGPDESDIDSESDGDWSDFIDDRALENEDPSVYQTHASEPEEDYDSTGAPEEFSEEEICARFLHWYTTDPEAPLEPTGPVEVISSVYQERLARLRTECANADKRPAVLTAILGELHDLPLPLNRSEEEARLSEFTEDDLVHVYAERCALDSAWMRLAENRVYRPQVKAFMRLHQRWTNQAKPDRLWRKMVAMIALWDVPLPMTRAMVYRSETEIATEHPEDKEDKEEEEEGEEERRTCYSRRRARPSAGCNSWRASWSRRHPPQSFERCNSRP